MTLQTDALSEQRSAAISEDPAVTGDDDELTFTSSIAVIAVAAGDGLANALRSMGATTIISGGQTMNPSTEDLLRAVEDAPVNNVLVLPNNKNIILAANQLQGLTDRTVQIIPTISVPQGLAALSAFNGNLPLMENVQRMTDMLGSVTTIELTRAVRDVEIDGLKIASGQVIALVDDVLKTAGGETTQVLADALAFCDTDAAELVTVFTGAEAEADDIAAVETALADLLPDAEVEVQAGGQPHYLFVIGIE